ncbi:hypothetical protein C8J57DRAFT_1538168 [Mycena rebaudengoi]|nr:hypothetical protein C8J57DRAFT_1538168 [Mycena rebaudengoi]
MSKLGLHLVPSVGDLEVHAQNEPPVVIASRIIQDVLNIGDGEFDVDVPLSSYGVDSLAAGRLSFALQSIMQVSQIQLMANNSLSDLMRKFSQSSRPSEQSVPEPKPITQIGVMEEFVSNFTDRLKSLAILPLAGSTAPCTMHIVLVTGTTGILGSHILAELLERDDVEHPSRNSDLELSPEVSDELLSSVTHIIQNVDFLAALSEFEPHIVATHKLIEFALRSKCSTRPSFSFISTISVYWNTHGADYSPEAPITDASIAAANGYLGSKWVAEQFVRIVSEERYLNANVIRVGLLTGNSSGAFDTAQWLPALIQSGPYLGCLPDGDDAISWIPIDTAAAAIVDMQTCMNTTLHVIHPRQTT